MNFEYSQEKNEMLFYNRGITFNNAIESIAENGILLDFEHPNKDKYPDQRILVVSINNYPYCIPYIKKGDTLYLITIYPARKFKNLIKDDK
jgi:uncharacterized DUF497 family protein